jgi:hypothetical protein
MEVIKEKYTEKFGEEEGLKRALLTYKMVRLLTLHKDDWYANKNAQDELLKIITNTNKYIVKVENPIQDLFPIKTTLLDLLK